MSETNNNNNNNNSNINKITLDKNIIPISKPSQLKDAPESFIQLLDGWVKATVEQRKCMTDEKSAELKLMDKCSNCNKFHKLNTDSIRNEKCTTHPIGSCRHFSTTCLECRRKRNNTIRAMKVLDPNSGTSKSKEKAKELQKQRKVTDPDYLLHERIRGQKQSYRNRQIEEKMYQDWYAKHNCIYGQCITCRRINHVLIESDHDERLMDDDEIKVDTIANISNLSDKMKELEKTQPLCVQCHAIKTYGPNANTVILYGKKEEARQLINNAKIGGCVCCKLKNPSIDLQLYSWYFDLDHIDNKNKADWFKQDGRFCPRRLKYGTIENLKVELFKCQTLCHECHVLKTYMEHSERHTLSRHECIRKDRPDFFIWYAQTYRHNPEMLGFMNSERSKTNDFVYINTNKPYKRKVELSEVDETKKKNLLNK